MTDRTQTRDNAYRWGMLMWFNQLLLDRGTITEAEFRQMRLKIEDSVKRQKTDGAERQRSKVLGGTTDEEERRDIPDRTGRVFDPHF